jgi:predicted membrane metal-binding protein
VAVRFAVAALIFWYQLAPMPGGKRSWLLRQSLALCHLQIGLMFLLAPLQIALFHGISLTSVLANLIAVPLVTFVVVPLILPRCFCTSARRLSLRWRSGNRRTVFWRAILVLTTAAARLAGAGCALAWDKLAAVAGVDRLAFSCLAHVARVLFSISRAIELAILAEYGC